MTMIPVVFFFHPTNQLRDAAPHAVFCGLARLALHENYTFLGGMWGL